MKKADELREEYRREDLGRGIRGKYYRECVKGTNLVLLRPEIAQACPTAEAVNDAFQSLIDVATRLANLTTRSTWTRRKRRARLTRRPVPMKLGV
jgi:hypothetical protein